MTLCCCHSPNTEQQQHFSYIKARGGEWQLKAFWGSAGCTLSPYNQAICMRKRDETLSALTQISQEELFSRAREQQQQPKSHGNCFISAITKARVALKEENHIWRREKFESDSTLCSCRRGRTQKKCRVEGEKLKRILLKVVRRHAMLTMCFELLLMGFAFAILKFRWIPARMVFTSKQKCLPSRPRQW